MSLALYRKYRPQTFADLVGQNHIKTTLQSELQTDKVAHAYLFSGPRGLGKTTVARLMAKSVNCLNRKSGQGEPCNECDSCKEVIEGRSLDVIEIDAASHTGVDNVRENIIGSSRFTPTSRKYKVFIIDEVHMLSLSSFNALLKTLEEPPSHVIFILATTEIHKIPQTIISRCQRFDFRKVPLADLIKRLEKIVASEKRNLEKGIVDNIARRSEGSVRDAESLLGQILALGEKDITIEQAQLIMPASNYNLVFELLGSLLKKDAASSIALVNRLIQEGIDLMRFTDDLIEVLRKIVLVKISGGLEEFTHTLDKESEQQIGYFGKEFKLSQLLQMINIFLVARKDLKSADIIQLPLELAVVTICEDYSDDNPIIPFGGGINSTFSDNSHKPATKIIEVKKSPPKAAKPKELPKKISLTLEQVKEKWGEVLQALKKYNQVLASTLHLHRPTGLSDDGIIQISFKYKFYQQRLNDEKNRRVVEETLMQVFSLPLRVETIIVKELPEFNYKPGSGGEKLQDDSVNNLLKTFGGQIVD